MTVRGFKEDTRRDYVRNDLAKIISRQRRRRAKSP
jgi:hypothetical protein